MKDIWSEQKHHIKCLQDPPNITLYTCTGNLRKGGVTLPTLRSARGSTSLESVHLHLARFIPGSAANDIHFQAYLLNGITRWNAARASEAYSSPPIALRTFDVRLQNRANVLSEAIHGTKIFPLYTPPPQYTGESFGVEYLYQQSGMMFKPRDVDREIDEGFEGFQDEEEIQPPLVVSDDNTVVPPTDNDETDSGEENEVSSSIM